MSLSKYYSEGNFSSIYYKGFAGWISRKWHSFLERDRCGEVNTILELAATHGQHFEYVKHPYKTYFMTDILLNDSLLNYKAINGVKVFALDAQKMDLVESESIDRVVATCLLHHVSDLESVVAEVNRVLKPGGFADFLVPNDPSLIFNTGRVLITFPRARRSGWSWKDYWKYVKTDHVNEIHSMLPLLEKESFKQGLSFKIDKFPSNLLPHFMVVFFRISLVKL